MTPAKTSTAAACPGPPAAWTAHPHSSPQVLQHPPLLPPTRLLVLASPLAQPRQRRLQIQIHQQDNPRGHRQSFMGTTTAAAGTTPSPTALTHPRLSTPTWAARPHAPTSPSPSAQARHRLAPYLDAHSPTSGPRHVRSGHVPQHHRTAAPTWTSPDVTYIFAPPVNGALVKKSKFMSGFTGGGRRY